MKNLFIVSFVLISFLGFSQKIVYIYNLSSYPVTFGTVYSLPNNAVPNAGITDASWYPNLASDNSTFIIPSGSTYVLENTYLPLSPNHQYRFPFESSGSSPYITNWNRWSGYGMSPSHPSSLAAAISDGLGQQFWKFKFQMGVNGSRGGGVIGEDEFDFPEDISGTGMWAYYATNTYDTITEYIIMFIDM